MTKSLFWGTCDSYWLRDQVMLLDSIKRSMEGGITPCQWKRQLSACRVEQRQTNSWQEGDVNQPTRKGSTFLVNWKQGFGRWCADSPGDEPLWKEISAVCKQARRLLVRSFSNPQHLPYFQLFSYVEAMKLTLLSPEWLKVLRKSLSFQLIAKCKSLYFKMGSKNF